MKPIQSKLATVQINLQFSCHLWISKHVFKSTNILCRHFVDYETEMWDYVKEGVT